MDPHSFDRVRNLATDFAGNLEKISIMRSVGMDSKFSPLFIAFEERLLPWKIVGLCYKQACSN